jgi:TonB family protein
MGRKSFGRFGWGWASSVAVHATLGGSLLLAHRPGYQHLSGPHRPLDDLPDPEVAALNVDVREETDAPPAAADAPPLVPAPTFAEARPIVPVKTQRRATVAQATRPHAAPPVRQPRASLPEPASVTAPPPPARTAEPAPTMLADQQPSAEEIGAAAAEIHAVPGGKGGRMASSWLPTAATEQPPPAITAREASYLRTYETFPNLPRSLWVYGRTYRVLVEVCVTDAGEVADVMVKSGAAPELDQTLVSAVRSWRYRPRIVGGAARPFCHLMKMEYKLQG